MLESPDGPADDELREAPKTPRFIALPFRRNRLYDTTNYLDITDANCTMTDDSIRERLLALTSQEQRSVISRIETLLPEIEAAFAAGAKRAAILEILNDEGIQLEAAVFTTYLHRLRARRDRQVVPAAPLPRSRPKATANSPVPTRTNASKVKVK